MAKLPRKNQKPKYGHSPDRFDDASVVGEQPDKQEYHVHQENMDQAMIDPVSFPLNRPMQGSWGVATDELQRIDRKTKGRK